MNILALTDLRGRIQYADRLAEVCQNTAVEAVVFTGNIVADGACKMEHRPDDKTEGMQDQEQADRRLYERFFHILGALHLPSYIVPGHLDAPERTFLWACLNCGGASTVVLVHRSMAQIGPGFLVAGMGGRLSADRREAVWKIEHPFGEAVLNFNFAHLPNRAQILLIHTPPINTTLDLHGGQHIGSPLVNALINAYRPQIVFCGHALDGQGTTTIVDSLVVNPGPLAEGCFAVLDTRQKQVYFGNVCGGVHNAR